MKGFRLKNVTVDSAAEADVVANVELTDAAR